MANAFISYSTLDADFGRTLHAALINLRRDVWMDWTNIQITSEWWEQIQDGIETADNFVLLVSPNSIASPICQLEISYARSLNKRIIPVLIAETDERVAFANLVTRDLNELQRALLGSDDVLLIARDNWKVLSGIQWIDFTRDTFDAGVQSLTHALDLDLEYVSEHTRLLVRAKDWDRHGRRPSLMLTGIDLLQAEAWLTQAEAVIPPPTPEHVAYIRESRRLEDERITRERRQRRLTNTLMAAAAAFVIVAILTGIYAGTQTQQAADANATLTPITANIYTGEAQIVENQQRIQSIRLAGESGAARERGENELAALLAVRAWTMQHTAQAEAALQRVHFLLAQRVFVGHSVEVNGAVFSPGGQFILTASSDGTARLWDASTGAEIRRFVGHNGSVTGAEFSPDGSLIVTSGTDGTVRLWDVAAGDEIRRLDGDGTPILAVSISADSRYVLTAGADGTARLWDIDFSGEVRRFVTNSGAVNTAVFSPDGRYVLTSSNDSTARLYDADTGEEIRRFDGHRDQVNSASFSVDGQFALTAGADGTARVWKIQSGAEVQRLDARLGVLNSAMFSSDSRYILLCSDDHTANIWDTATGAQLLTLDGHSGAVQTGAFSIDGRYAITSSADGTARLWNPATGIEIRQFQAGRSAVNSAAISPDGSMLASAEGDGTMTVWDVSADAALLSFTASGQFNGVAFSPDGRFVAAANADGSALMWDLHTSDLVRRFEGHTDAVNSLVFSPDGQYLLTAATDRTARLWDIATGVELRRFEGHADAVNFAAFSPDASRIATASADQTVRIWDTATATETGRFEEHTGSVYSAAFSPDGRYVLTSGADRSARLWDAETRTELRRFEGHQSSVFRARFNGDGRYVVTASGDQSARLWEVSQASEVRRMIGHSGTIFDVEISADEQFIMTASADGSVRLWSVNLDPERVIDELCSRLSREFSEQERLLYAVDETPTCRTFGDVFTPISAVAAPSDTWTAVPTRTLPIFTAIALIPTVDPLRLTTAPSYTAVLSPTASVTHTPSITPTLIPITLQITPYPTRTLLPSTPIDSPTPSPVGADSSSANAITVVEPMGRISPFGDNRGEIGVGEVDVWTYQGTAGEELTIMLVAETPSRMRAEDPRDPDGLDTFLVIRDLDGDEIASNDDVEDSGETNSSIERLILRADGTYEIQVGSSGNLTAGSYRLIVESNFMPLATESP